MGSEAALTVGFHMAAVCCFCGHHGSAMATFPEEWFRGGAFASSDPCLPRCVHGAARTRTSAYDDATPPTTASTDPSPHLPNLCSAQWTGEGNSVGLSGQVATDRRRCRARPALCLALVFRVAAPTGGHLTSHLLVVSRDCLLGDVGREFWPPWWHLPLTLSLAALWEMG